MTVLAGKRGSWINQYALPTVPLFIARAKDVDYVIIKYGHPEYEQLAVQNNVPWLAELMGEAGVGSQSGPSHAIEYGQKLADQANQPGAIGAVVNLEEADGGWHLDDGTGVKQLVYVFRAHAPGKPLFASIDTRGNRPNYPYQRALAELLDGVMPMTYPGAFGLTAAASFAATVTPLVRERWAGKDIIPTYQAYDSCPVPPQVAELNKLYTNGIIAGANSYTLGHALAQQWEDGLAFVPGAKSVPLPPDVATALVAIRKLWVDGWGAIAQKGTVAEALSLAEFWSALTGQP